MKTTKRKNIIFYLKSISGRPEPNQHNKANFIVYCNQKQNNFYSHNHRPTQASSPRNSNSQARDTPIKTILSIIRKITKYQLLNQSSLAIIRLNQTFLIYNHKKRKHFYSSRKSKCSQLFNRKRIGINAIISILFLGLLF